MTLPTGGEKEFDQMLFRQELATMDMDALNAQLAKTDRRENFLKFTLIREEIDRRQTEKAAVAAATENDDPKPIHIMDKPLDPKITQAQFEATLGRGSRLLVDQALEAFAQVEGALYGRQCAGVEAGDFEQAAEQSVHGFGRQRELVGELAAALVEPLL